MQINPTKSEHLQVSSFKFSSTSSLPSPKFNILNTHIPFTDTVRDLGVTLSSNLKFSAHVNKIYSRAICQVYMILRSFRSKVPSFYVNLYKLYVRPIVEYNCITWSPLLISDVNKIESVQRLFTRKLLKNLNLSYTNYHHRLEILQLETLEMRRVKLDLIFTYKILHGLVDINNCDFLKINPIVRTHNLRRHKFHLQLPYVPKSLIASNFFTYRILNVWNKLPSRIVCSETLAIFKSQLNKLDLAEYFETKLQI